MITTCEGCGAFVVERTWDRERSFVERYACGSRHRWGEGPEQLEPCPIQHAKEVGAAMERAAVIEYVELEARRIAKGGTLMDQRSAEQFGALAVLREGAHLPAKEEG